MTHEGINFFLNKVANTLGRELIYHNKSNFTFRLIIFFKIVLNSDISDFKALYLASIQRQIRRSKNAKINRLIASLYLLKNLYYIGTLAPYLKNHDVILFPTSEPYIESMLLRYLSKHFPESKLFIYSGRDYLGIQNSIYDYSPSHINLEKIKSEIINLINNDLNVHKISGVKKYNPGTKYLGNDFSNINLKLIPGSYYIFAHDFFDAPAIYGQGVFDDLVSWFEFTIDYLIKNKLNFYIKPHPNQLKESDFILNNILDKFNLSHDVILKMSLEDIKKNDPECRIITNHGSVIIEAIQHEIPIISSSPSIASYLGFHTPAWNLDTYKKNILTPNPIIFKHSLMYLLAETKHCEFDFYIEFPLIYSRKINIENSIRTCHELKQFCNGNIQYKIEVEKACDSFNFKKIIEFLDK